MTSSLFLFRKGRYCASLPASTAVPSLSPRESVSVSRAKLTWVARARSVSPGSSSRSSSSAIDAFGQCKAGHANDTQCGLTELAREQLVRYVEPDVVGCLGADVVHSRRRDEADDASGHAERDEPERYSTNRSTCRPPSMKRKNGVFRIISSSTPSKSEVTFS